MEMLKSSKLIKILENNDHIIVENLTENAPIIEYLLGECDFNEVSSITILSNFSMKNETFKYDLLERLTKEQINFKYSKENRGIILDNFSNTKIILTSHLVNVRSTKTNILVVLDTDEEITTYLKLLSEKESTKIVVIGNNDELYKHGFVKFSYE